jgi:hypothetical protein
MLLVMQAQRITLYHLTSLSILDYPKMVGQPKARNVAIEKALTLKVKNILFTDHDPVIIVDTFSGDKINRYLDTLHRLDEKITIKIFGLFTTDEELKSRLKIRMNKEFKDFSISKKLNDDVLKWKHDSEFQINTTGLSSSQTAQKIHEQL